MLEYELRSSTGHLVIYYWDYYWA